MFMANTLDDCLIRLSRTGVGEARARTLLSGPGLENAVDIDGTSCRGSKVQVRTSIFRSEVQRTFILNGRT